MQENKHKLPVIACDLDDTIEKLLEAWLRWLNKKYHLNVRYHEVTHWEMTKAFPDLTEKQIFEPLFIEEFWKTVTPMYDAVIYVKLLIEEGFPFYIVTASHPDTISYKFNHIIAKYFPFIPSSNVIYTCCKQMIRCDILIDDGIHNIQGPYIGLLKDTPHNQEFNEQDHSNIKRVYCWKNIYETIHSIADSLIVE